MIQAKEAGSKNGWKNAISPMAEAGDEKVNKKIERGKRRCSR